MSGNARKIYRRRPSVETAVRAGLQALLLLFGVVALASIGQAEPQWSTYNNTLEANRFSSLTGITPRNAADLRVKCELALGDEGAFQSGPLVIDDVLFVTTANTTVALGAADCKERWRHAYTPEEDEIFPVNRGLAYLDGKLFRGTNDGRLIALDAKTGKELWRVKAADPKIGEYFSAAPVAWKGLLFIGPAGSDYGIRGRMQAFEAATGREVWRFNTIPVDDEPGADSWKIPDTAQRGGGGTWTSYALDPSTGELFIPVGNPAPDLNPDLRPGDNLYTNSLVVLEAATGQLKWYYQFRANDGFDYDASAAPALFTDRAGRRRVASATKDGHLYVIDRASHRLIFKTPITTIFNADKKPTPEGTRACPGPLGGVQWNGPAYSPVTDMIYVGAVDWCGFYQSAPIAYDPPKLYMGTNFMPAKGEPMSGWITAVAAGGGAVVWRHHTTAPVVAAVSPTASGVLFGGDLSGNLLSFDARSGKLLAEKNLEGALAGGIVTYSIAGRQYVAVTAGNLSRGVFPTTGSPRIVILTTGLGKDHRIAKETIREMALQGGLSDLERGKITYGKLCSACHGTAGEGGSSGPQLNKQGVRKNFAQVVGIVKKPVAPMPTLYPQLLNDDEVRAVAVYVQSLP
jgi:alcohol dehydrogenase (cytochrome c)